MHWSTLNLNIVLVCKNFRNFSWINMAEQLQNWFLECASNKAEETTQNSNVVPQQILFCC
jgi:hypothetical protein